MKAEFLMGVECWHDFMSGQVILRKYPADFYNSVCTDRVVCYKQLKPELSDAMLKCWH